ncbi:MAG TPA: divalent-cation tolerance protein CutA [Candidatus Nanoarchaeia archaeon]|nr:divalent-cation tolerance protein CutA [Candidatus Nanoarchaeia archaeon]
MVLLYVTCKNIREAEKISIHLLNKKLIACANIFPVKSMYLWKGKIAKSKECVMIAKTSNKNLKKAENEIKRMHSYDVPCILNINSGANKECLDWIKKEIG